ncbi:hypothetical protein [Jannaschia sp. M317]|uniref:hypothetical protein n=1 Tax=Jannaschia sp. M317 TaxID=2867011 RepID=UPI0021A4B694|nr:hypothetical protein [Jannaschia sp. M317]UWQ17582.1 hypothetical protein K3551_17180 [Jannaschia sp. M317]
MDGPRRGCAARGRRAEIGRAGASSPPAPVASGGGISGQRKIALLLACVLAGPVSADPWFHHPFGELRAYHADWLAVCRDLGDGLCRAVQFRRLSADGFFGEGRLTLALGPDGWTQGVYDGTMAAGATLSASVDGAAPVALEARAGEPDLSNVSQSVWAPVPTSLLAALRGGNRLRVLFPGGEETYSLRGITAATDAILVQVARRTD